MIDLHCHLLPGIDDGPADIATALEMARIAVADGITHTACTPHIYPGLYHNTARGIRSAVGELRNAIERAGLPLSITHGADIHLAPEVVPSLQRRTYPTLADSRYFLLEPPHHTVPARFLETIEESVSSGYVPIITHPERLTWLTERHYQWLVQAVASGAWIQVTASALTGHFGQTAQRWGERLLDDGLVHVLATDAHDPRHRPPVLSAGRDIAAQRVGAQEAERLVVERPAAVLADREPSQVAPPPMLTAASRASAYADHPPRPSPRSWLSRLLGPTRHHT
jgi:protein-tyrosine phosphatase